MDPKSPDQHTRNNQDFNIEVEVGVGDYIGAIMTIIMVLLLLDSGCLI